MRPNPQLRLEGRGIGGLRPSEWIIVDQGVSREDLKEFFLSRGIGFTAPAIQDVGGLCRWILGTQVDAKRVLSSAARQEVLRRIVGERDGPVALTELKRLRRQKGFYKKLDRSVQKARTSYSSLDELAAQLERLALVRTKHPTRDELRAVITTYEAWLSENQAWDLPRLLIASIGVLGVSEIELALPEKITVLSAIRGEGRGEYFWDALAVRVPVERVVLSELAVAPIPPDEVADRVRWESWHTVDDAAEHLADELHRVAMAGELHRHGVLIPDLPSVRRSLTRALSERGILPEDPRDPTKLRFEEGIKQAFLPLDLISRNFEKNLALAYLLSPFSQMPLDLRKASEQEIEDLGILQGLGNYRSAKLVPLREEWNALRGHFKDRMTIEELKEAHLETLRTAGELRYWVRDFFSEQWEQFQADLLVVEGRLRKAPPRYWIERLRTRIDEATPPVERVNWRGGLQIYRTGQRPLQYPENLWALALPGRYTTEEERGDYWLSARERDVLSGHFTFRSSFQSATERKQELQTWFSAADRVVLLDAEYEATGGERESLRALLTELGLAPEKQSLGAHPRWRRSYAPATAQPAVDFRIAPLARKVVSASELENASRCEFRGLIMGRWKLKEAQEADLDLRADSRGTLLHEAVRVLLDSRDAAGAFSRPLSEIVEEAWMRKRPKGVLQSDRLIENLKRRLEPVLKKFAEQESAYLARSGARTLSLEGPELRVTIGDVEIKGIPDRIDEVGDGLLIIDFKSSSANPAGKDIIEHGYRLQMPIYALAAEKQFGRPVVALQFVSLSKKGARNQGVFPVSVIGEESGKVLKLTKRSNSYIEKEASEIWPGLERQIVQHLERYLSGHVRVIPKKLRPQNPFGECATCPVSNLCGQRRFLVEEEGESDE